MEQKIYQKKKILVLMITFTLIFVILIVRLGYLMIFRADYYSQKAKDLHERERVIKAARGRILDRNGVVLADNKTVCTISVIHSQITDANEVVRVLAKELSMTEDVVRKKVERVSSIEKIKSNVSKEIGDAIRAYNLAGVKVDEDYKRYYVYDELASKVLGFTGGDNQGILGLEVKYEEYLSGEAGKILTLTDSRGIELDFSRENRIEPEAGDDLYISIDYNIQTYAQQLAYTTLEKKQAKAVSIIVMNPNNGEIYAMANVPEYNLNDPFTLPEGSIFNNETEKYALLNNMWRNTCVNDTYEPGSTFKMITASIGLEENIVSLDNSYTCPGYKMVEDRRIRCHKTQGHGTQTFAQTLMNSCNPAFIEWGLRVGTDRFFEYFDTMGINGKTGIDLPGEAATIMHNKKNVGQVELATVSFGQSFQITPIQMLRTTASIINGGKIVTPHFAISSGEKTFLYNTKDSSISEETSATMRSLLESVVSEGGGKLAQVEGYSIGGKTATSEKLPRGNGKYIASFIGFAPANNPQVIAMCIIDEPQGVYYGGTIAAPVIGELFDNILPYLEIEK
ncbi:MAG: peptidoglycan glycosyltransferase [Lachnospiraceae bacterium]|nr:peptidoglycan glycosyltransferase [Lachnospiraceae bacterium]